MGRDWERLGLRFKQAREGRNMTQGQLAKATGQNLSTIQNLESARWSKGFNRTPKSAFLVAQYLGWDDDSVAAVLAGGEPTLETAVAEAGRPPERIFDDPRARQIWLLELPVDERVQGILEMIEEDLKRAKEREELAFQDAREQLRAVRSGEGDVNGEQPAG